MRDYDIIIVGAGIAGTSLAYELAYERNILVLEQEFAPGYHATGRSAAFWSQTYGGPYIEPLTSASGDFLRNPPPDFHEGSFLNNRGAINIARNDQKNLTNNMIEQFTSNSVELSLVDKLYLNKHIPFLQKNWDNAVWEPECSDIDVSSLHNAYIKNAKRLGVEIACSSPLLNAEYKGSDWTVETNGKTYKCKILINAAGAWADDVAIKSGVKPMGVNAYRRTMIELEMATSINQDLPLIVALDGSFYFKALANNHIWLSPHDETICQACDVAPDEMDVAIAIDRLQNIVDWDIKRITHKWAGLRSFSKDRLPIIGFDTQNTNYFWFVGQGGFGIQTSPVTSQMAAYKLLKKDKPHYLSHIDDRKYAPARFN